VPDARRPPLRRAYELRLLRASAGPLRRLAAGARRDAARAAHPRGPARGASLLTDDRWAWLRPGRHSLDDEGALRRLAAELEALREREPIG
jgi:hypothetical protein